MQNYVDNIYGFPYTVLVGNDGKTIGEPILGSFDDERIKEAVGILKKEIAKQGNTGNSSNAEKISKPEVSGKNLYEKESLTMKNADIKKKAMYGVLPVAAPGLLFLLSNGLMYATYVLFLNVIQMSAKQFAEIAYLAEAAVGMVLMAIFFGIYSLIFRKDNRSMRELAAEDIKAAGDCKKINFSWKDGLMSFAAGLGVSGVSYIWIKIAEHIPIFEKSLSSMDKSNAEIGTAPLAGLFLSAVVIAPLLEEILFRGIVFRAAERVKTGWLPVIVSAVIFGAYHMNLVQAFYATFMGIVAAIVYMKTRNLIYPILVHMANNLLGAIQELVPESAVMATNILTLVMIIPLIYILYVMLKGSGLPLPHKNEKVSQLT